MIIGWQEIISIGIVVVACLILVRRFTRRVPGAPPCGRCSETSSDGAVERQVRITELHVLEVDKEGHAENSSS